MSELDRLGAVGQLVRQPAFEELLEARRRRTLRARIATAAVLAVAATVTVGALAAIGDDLRVDPPPADLSPSPSPSPSQTKVFEVPAGQQTVSPDIGPADLTGFQVLATVTNTQPRHVGDTYLSATVTAHVDTSSIVYDCRSHEVPTWIAFADGDLVSDSPGGAHDWWTFRKCESGDPMSLAPAADLNGFIDKVVGLEQKTARVFAMAPPSQELLDCIAGDGSGGYCPVPEPLKATDAEFGFRIYDDPAVPPVMQLFDDAGNGEPWYFGALTSIDGVAWLLDRAVVAAPDSHRLAFELPASDPEHVVDVYVGRGPHRERCLKQHADELPDWESTDTHVYEAAVEQVCGVDLRLLVDGNPIAPVAVDPHGTGHFTELGARLPSGTDHQVEVQVVRGDPRDIRYAVVVRTLTQLP